MKLLLDTHVVVWWAEGSPRIPAEWVEAIVDPANEALVSAASAWEVEIKKRSGKLAFSPMVLEVAADSGFTLLAISVEDAILAGSLDWDHRDPFDRLLAAQSAGLGLTLVTQDQALLSAPGVRAF
ncbi:type II toxin-antitoxin system VapC family toxin [soil metagenome]